MCGDRGPLDGTISTLKNMPHFSDLFSGGTEGDETRAVGEGLSGCPDFNGSERSRLSGVSGVPCSLWAECDVPKIPKMFPVLRSCLKTEGSPRICVGETDLRTDKSKSNDEIQGSFTPLRMTAIKQTMMSHSF